MYIMPKKQPKKRALEDIGCRTTEEQKKFLTQAAQLDATAKRANVSRNSFILNAAIDKAVQIFEQAGLPIPEGIRRQVEGEANGKQ